MKTEIRLEEPYSKDWKKCYLVTNRENRKTVILYNSKTDRSTTQYARYLMTVKLGRYLTKDETVDHIDEDKTNDAIDNLQVLSLNDNIAKHIDAHKEAIKHGTYAGYRTLGCRCDLCKAYNSEYQKKWRENRKLNKTIVNN